MDSGSTVPIWIFSAADDTVAPSGRLKNIAESKSHVYLTEFVQGGHSAGWSNPTFGSVNGDYDYALSEYASNKVFNTSVYDWLETAK